MVVYERKQIYSNQMNRLIDGGNELGNHYRFFFSKCEMHRLDGFYVMGVGECACLAVFGTRDENDCRQSISFAAAATTVAPKKFYQINSKTAAVNCAGNSNYMTKQLGNDK